MIEILHLSHTNIISDKRIVKELNAIAEISNEKFIRAVGLRHNKIFKDIDNEINPTIDVLSIECGVYSFISKLPRLLRLIILGPILIYIEMILLFYKAALDRKWTIIHCHDALLLPLATFLSIKNNSKLIYDAHELESETNRISRLGKIYVLIAEKFSWDKIYAVITVSKGIGDWYANKYSYKNIKIVMNSPEFKCCKLNLNETNSKSVNYVYVGLMSRGRGIESLLEHFKSNASNNITFIGDGEMFEDIEYNSKLCENIKILKPMNHDDMMVELLNYDVGLCLIPESTSLSDYFALPNKIFEYIFAGLYVFSTNLPEVKTLLSNTKSGRVISSNDLNEIHLLEDVITESRYQGVVEHYDWNSQSKKLISLYMEIINP